MYWNKDLGLGGWQKGVKVVSSPCTGEESIEKNVWAPLECLELALVMALLAERVVLIDCVNMHIPLD